MRCSKARKEALGDEASRYSYFWADQQGLSKKKHKECGMKQWQRLLVREPTRGAQKGAWDEAMPTPTSLGGNARDKSRA